MTHVPMPGDALLSRTPAGTAELNQPSDALTLSQRKLLLLIQRGTTFQSLMDNSSSIDPRARAEDLARLFALRFVAATDRTGNAIDGAHSGESARQSAARTPEPAASVSGPAASVSGPAASVPEPTASREVTRGTRGNDADSFSTYDGDQSVHELRDRNEALASSPHRRRGPYIAVAVVLLLVAVGLTYWQVVPDETRIPPGVEGAKPESATSPISQRPLYPDEPVKAPSVSAPAAGHSDAATGRAGTPAADSRMPATTPDTSKSRREQVDAAKAASGKAKGTGAIVTAPPAIPTSPVPPPSLESSASPPDVSSAPPPSKAASTATSPAAVVGAPLANDSKPAITKPTPAAAAAAPAPPAPGIATAPTTTPTTTARVARPSAPRLIVRVNPDFPPDAARSGIKSGTVRARMKVDADGNVTDVEIVESSPARVFDRAVLRALAQWKYESTGAPRTVDHELEFR